MQAGPGFDPGRPAALRPPGMQEYSAGICGGGRSQVRAAVTEGTDANPSVGSLTGVREPSGNDPGRTVLLETRFRVPAKVVGEANNRRTIRGGKPQ